MLISIRMYLFISQTTGFHIVSFEDISAEHIVFVASVAYKTTHDFATMNAHPHLNTLSPATN